MDERRQTMIRMINSIIKNFTSILQAFSRIPCPIAGKKEILSEMYSILYPVCTIIEISQAKDYNPTVQVIDELRRFLASGIYDEAGSINLFDVSNPENRVLIPVANLC